MNKPISPTKKRTIKWMRHYLANEICLDICTKSSRLRQFEFTDGIENDQLPLFLEFLKNPHPQSRLQIIKLFFHYKKMAIISNETETHVITLIPRSISNNSNPKI